jgi:hypothetical protein
MDSEQFDALVAKLAAAATRRQTVKSLIGGTLASVSAISIASAKNGKRTGGKSKNRNGRNGGKGNGGNDGNGGVKRKKKKGAPNRMNLRAQKKKPCNKKNGKNCSRNQASVL